MMATTVAAAAPARAGEPQASSPSSPSRPPLPSPLPPGVVFEDGLLKVRRIRKEERKKQGAGSKRGAKKKKTPLSFSSCPLVASFFFDLFSFLSGLFLFMINKNKQSIFGWTWPGIEWGEAPGPRHTYYEVREKSKERERERKERREAVTFFLSFQFFFSLSLSLRRRRRRSAFALFSGFLLLLLLLPPPPPTNHQYLQSLRDDDLGLFSRIQAADRAWWHPLTDRGGTGCSLHAAAGACASRSVRFLVEVKKVPVNARARSDGATPLHRAAAAAHHARTDPRAMEVIEYLLSKGADPEARTRGTTRGRTGEREEEEGGEGEGGGGDSLSVLGCAVERGHGWAVGEVRGMLQEAFARHASVPKAPLESLDEEEEEKRRGRRQRPRPPPVAAAGAALLRTWRLLAPSLPYPPSNWRPPPPAGWAGAVGTLACGGGVAGDFETVSSFADGGGKGGGKGGGGNENATSFSSSAGGPQAPGWRPAGSPGDGSCWLRRATKAELDAQAAAAAALAEPA